MRNHFQVVGVGNPSFDHIFEGNPGTVKYKYSRGGGTVTNILANLAFLGVDNVLLGECGTSIIYGDAALNDLDSLGTDTTFVRKVPNKGIQIIFQVNNKSENSTSHEFSRKCVICEKTPNHIKMQMDYVNSLEYKSLNFENCSVIVADRINKKVVRLVQDVKHNHPHIMAVIDIGHVSGLRFSSIEEICNMLIEFDVVFMNEVVYKFLNKLVDNNSNILSRLCKLGKFPHIFVVTKGENGVDFFIKDGSNYIEKHIQAIKYKPACTSGAGDALLSFFIHNFLKLNFNPKHFYSNIEVIDFVLRECISELEKVLNSLGARGHLPLMDLNLSVNQFSNMQIDDIRKEIIDKDFCPFCFSKSSNYGLYITPPNRNIDKVIDVLSYRGFGALFSLDTIGKCRQVLSEGQTYSVVGTGGSRSPALYISQIIAADFHKFANFLYPYDYYKGLGQKNDWLIILSYSGSTNDCGLAIQRAIDLGVKRIALVTSKRKPKLVNMLRNVNLPDGDIVIDYENRVLGNEKGFLSFAGVIVPSILFAASSNLSLNETDIRSIFESASSQDYEDFDLFINKLSIHKSIELIGGAFSLPALYDLESKLVEGGICSVQVHESKDFSHGRFMYSLKKPGLDIPKILLKVGTDKYEHALLSEIKRKGKNTPIISIEAKEDGVKGGLELLLKIQYFIYNLSKALYGDSKDITKPSSIPSEGLKLYRWKP